MQITKKTSSGQTILGLTIKFSLFLVVAFGVIFLLNKIDFPSPTKEIKKIIPNENFKIVK
jgi:hypothetical protein|tara:strand:+ start:714 stop:893 length:180 start_codon:yes stop_codon:yes gene_type:complete